MHKKVLVVIGLVVLLGSCKVESNNNEGQRIISTSLLTDEILVEILPIAEIVAFSALAADPSYSIIHEKVAKSSKPGLSIKSVEQIIALKPSLVVAADWADASALANLKKFGIRVEIIKSPTTFNDLYDVIRVLGQLTSAIEEADRLINQTKIKEMKLAYAVAQLKHQFTMIDYSLAGISASKSSSIGHIIAHAGLINGADLLIAERDPYGFVTISAEQLIYLDPDYIYGGAQTSVIATNPAFSQLKAFKNNHFISLNHEESLALYSVSHYMLCGAMALYRSVYGNI